MGGPGQFTNGREGIGNGEWGLAAGGWGLGGHRRAEGPEGKRSGAGQPGTEGRAPGRPVARQFPLTTHRPRAPSRQHLALQQAPLLHQGLHPDHRADRNVGDGNAPAANNLEGVAFRIELDLARVAA